jgi:xanthine dehydrogenase accessory factor
MLVGETGRLWGTVGGGAIEYRCLELARTVLQTGVNREETFQLTPDDLHKLGMVCGGSARVLLQVLSADSLAVADRAVRELDAGGELWLVSHCSGGLALYRRNEVPRELHAYLTKRPVRVQEAGLDLFIEQIGTLGSVYIFGAGHVGRELEPLLSRLGFRCVVVDDRPEYADHALFPTAAEVICTDFEDLSHVTVGEADYVCIMTRGHAHDSAVLTQVLAKNPRYVGLMGSRRKIAAVHDLLREKGFTQTQIDHVTAPIGLAIGAQTPAEIAVSIAAQLIAIRAET